MTTFRRSSQHARRLGLLSSAARRRGGVVHGQNGDCASKAMKFCYENDKSADIFVKFEPSEEVPFSEDCQVVATQMAQGLEELQAECIRDGLHAISCPAKGANCTIIPSHCCPTSESIVEKMVSIYKTTVAPCTSDTFTRVFRLRAEPREGDSPVTATAQSVEASTGFAAELLPWIGVAVVVLLILGLCKSCCVGH
eukprot:GHVQ01011134.1.p1 GENE.GHVQ01011134.1~~GHVQ01011134.1.p1  ORF type:complete len:207 (+),score=0.74 GHVQ01011134.1:36-623(+)